MQGNRYNGPDGILSNHARRTYRARSDALLFSWEGRVKRRKIAVFDSGAGGEYIHRWIQQKLPQHDSICFADRQNFPYGNKAPEEVVRCVVQGVRQLISIHAPDLVVVACNTASTTALETLRREFAIPFVGVVPAVKPAASRTRTKVIALLATPATVQQAYTEQLIRDFCQGIEVVRVGSHRLAELAERKAAGEVILLEEIRREIFPILENSQVDTVVLGCTHYPLLLDEFRQLCPRPIEWLDSSPAIVARVESLLG